MSVVITLKFQGDVARFRQALTDHGHLFAKMAEEAKAVVRFRAGRAAPAGPRR